MDRLWHLNVPHLYICSRAGGEEWHVVFHSSVFTESPHLPHVRHFLSNSSLCWLIRESTILSKFPVIDTVVSAAALY